MKKSEHACAVPTCDRACPREYPLCTGCWYTVPLELRKAVRAELKKAEPDEAALYFAVSQAVASVTEGPAELTPETHYWELAWLKAGSPKLEEKRKR